MHFPSPPPALLLPWGISYVGTGDSKTARAAVEEALRRIGMTGEWREEGPQRFVLEAEQRAPWFVVLAKALPQKAIWIVDGSEGRLVVASDFCLYRWYMAVLLVLWLAIAAGFLGSDKLFGSGTLSEGACLIFVMIVLIPWYLHLLQALGGRLELLRQHILYDIERVDGRLHPVGLGGSIRFAVAVISFFVSIVFFAGWYIKGEGGLGPGFPPGFLAFIGTIGILIVLMVASLALSVGRKGFGLRFHAVGSGLLTMLSVVFSLWAILLPWWLLCHLDLRIVGSNRPALGRLAIGVCLILAAMAISCFLFAFRFYFQARPQVERIQARRNQGVYWAASGGISPLPFQIVIITCWVILAGLQLAGVGMLVLGVVHSFVPFSSQPELRLVEIAQALLAAAVGRPAGDPIVAVVVQAWWGSATLAGVWLFSISIGQFVRSRRQTLRNLREGAARPFPSRNELEKMLAEIRHDAGLPPARLALRRDRLLPGREEELSAEVHCFGLLRTERFIEISEDCMTLQDGEIRAILCHECAHDLLGHPRRDIVLRWLGRLSFAGDGFVRAVQNTFQNEKTADRIAADLLGADPKALKSRLLKAADKETGEVPPPATLERNPRPWRENWRSAFSSFRAQYFGLGGRNLHYWHPDARTRIEALEND